MATEETNNTSAARSRVFFDIHIGQRKAGRIVMELYNDVVPKTVSCCPSPMKSLPLTLLITHS